MSCQSRSDGDQPGHSDVDVINSRRAVISVVQSETSFLSSFIPELSVVKLESYCFLFLRTTMRMRKTMERRKRRKVSED